MSVDAGTTPDHDPDDDAVVAVLRAAGWTLPVPPGMVEDAVREVSRRRRRRVVAIALTSAAAVVLVVGGVSVFAGWPAGGPSTPSPSVESSQTPASAVDGRRVKVGSYSFAVPDGWVVDPLVSRSSARIGKFGLQNDGKAPGSTDMPVDLVARRISTPDHHATVYLSQLTPRPTAAHPGPSPAADPTDRRAAAATAMKVAYGADVGGATDVVDLDRIPLGPATEARFGDSAHLVLVAPTRTPVVVSLESVNMPRAELLQMLRSGSFG